MSKYEAIISIVNHGYSDLVMEAAKSAGARGGTILNGHGTGNRDMETFFGVTVTPEKDIVIIVVPAETKDSVLSAINKGAGMATKGMGIAFSCPITDVVGLIEHAEQETKEEGE